MDKALIVGLGEVGAALRDVLCKVHEVSVKDPDRGIEGPDNTAAFDFMHVCFPWQDAEQFRVEVGKLQQTYSVGATVVHSTVPLGTCAPLGAVHSPVMGLHPDLAQSLVTFAKFVGGIGAGRVAQHLGRAGIRCYVVDRAETTELLKVLSTTFYGLCIEWTKEVKELCRQHYAPFEAYTLWTQAYNEGYQALGRPEYTRPLLVPIMERIGGHCILPNLEMIESAFVELIKARNR